MENPLRRHGTDETPEDGLSSAQRRAIEAWIGSGGSLAEAARSAGVTMTTVYCWMDERRFAEALVRAKRKLLASVQAELDGMTGETVEVLREVLKIPSVMALNRVLFVLQGLKASGINGRESSDLLPPDRPAPGSAGSS